MADRPDIDALMALADEYRASYGADGQSSPIAIRARLRSAIGELVEQRDGARDDAAANLVAMRAVAEQRDAAWRRIAALEQDVKEARFTAETLRKDIAEIADNVHEHRIGKLPWETTP